MMKVLASLGRGAVGVGVFAALGLLAKDGGNLAKVYNDVQTYATVASVAGVLHTTVAHVYAYLKAKYAQAKADYAKVQALLNQK